MKFMDHFKMQSMANYSKALIVSLAPSTDTVFTTAKCKTKNMKFKPCLRNGEPLLQEWGSENGLKVTMCKHFIKGSQCCSGKNITFNTYSKLDSEKQITNLAHLF